MLPSDEWDGHWNAYAGGADLNPAQAYRQKLVGRLLELAAAAPVRILELGCGPGALAHELLSAYPQVKYLGLDRSAVAVAMAGEKARAGTFLVRDLEQPLDLPDSYLGWATHGICSELLEHVDDPVRILRHIRPYMEPGSRIVLTVPGGPRSAFDLHIGHRRHFTPASLSAVIRTAGFRPQAVYGAGFPFFNLYRLAVVASGRHLIEQARNPDFTAHPLTRITARVFSALFSASLARGRHGWQIVGVAVRP